MLIETWVAIMILAFMGVIGIICALGWVTTEQLLEKERERNEILQEQKEHLAVENSKMRFQLNLIREKIEMEMKK